MPKFITSEMKKNSYEGHGSVNDPQKKVMTSSEMGLLDYASSDLIFLMRSKVNELKTQSDSVKYCQENVC